MARGRRGIFPIARKKPGISENGFGDVPDYGMAVYGPDEPTLLPGERHSLKP